MNRGIIGVTVGTPISPKAIERKLKPVKSVNGVTPDENGNLVIQGLDGEDGVSIDQIVEWYYLSNYSDDYKGGSWSRLYPTWQEGKYLWTYLEIIYTDGTTDQTSPICVTGSKGATGAPGADGKNGVDGKDGTNGVDGSDGVGIKSVSQTTTSTADDGNNVITVTLTNGTKSTFKVQNGSQGSTGATGADGKTPVKGTDYWTEADKAEMVSDVIAALPVYDGSVVSV